MVTVIITLRLKLRVTSANATCLLRVASEKLAINIGKISRFSGLSVLITFY